MITSLKNLARKSLLLGSSPLIRLRKNLKGYIVLLYHRIVKDRAWDTVLQPELFIKSSEFEKQIDFISSICRPISLSEMSERIAMSVKADDLYVAVTFDDGYADNYLLGNQVLCKYGTKATIFVCPGFIENKRLIPYWDEVMFYASKLNKCLDFRDQFGSRYKFELSTPEHKKRFISSVCRSIYRTPNISESILCKIRAAAGEDAPSRNDFFSWELLNKAVRSGNYEIGCHSMTHSVPNMLKNNWEYEVVSSKSLLEKRLHIPVDLFSYPFGGGTGIETDENIKNVVKNAGFRCAFGNRLGSNTRNENPYLLKRIPILGGESLLEVKSKVLLADLFSHIYSLKNDFYKQKNKFA